MKKSGWKTSEFWLALAPYALVAVLILSGRDLSLEQVAAIVGALGAGAAKGYRYTASREKAKNGSPSD